MTTVAEIVKSSLRKLEVSRPSATELSDGMEALNFMLDNWASDPTIVSARTQDSFSLAASAATYSVGSGSTIDITWPGRVTSAYVRENGIDYPISVFSAEEYAYTPQKSIEQRPLALYYERTYPAGTFMFWPTPDQVYTGYIWSDRGFTTYTSTSTTVSLPPEYIAALIWNLAIELAPEFGKDISSVVIARASHTLKNIKNTNIHPIPQINTNVIGSSNIGASKSLFSMDSSSGGFSFTFPFVFRE